MGRPYQDDIADALCGQLEATVDERPHQHVAEVRVGLHQAEHLLARELKDLARLADLGASQRTPPENQVDLTGELARAMDGNEPVADVRRLDNLDLSALHDEERDHALPRLDQDLSCRDRAGHARMRDPADLCGRQRREHERLVRGADRRSRESRAHHEPRVRHTAAPCSYHLRSDSPPVKTTNYRAKAIIRPPPRVFT